MTKAGLRGFPAALRRHSLPGRMMRSSCSWWMRSAGGSSERFQDAPFIQRIARHGRIEKLTSQFPSTTAAHVTTIHTGLPVGVSGVHEWYYYEPQVDAVIAPLLFSHSGTRERDTLKSIVKPAAVYPQGVFYPALKKLGVKPYVFGIRDYTPSTYANVVMKGAKQKSFKTLSEALVNLGILIEEAKKPVYAHLYFDKIDALCHEYGPTAPQTEAEIETFLLMMEHYFDRIFKGRKRVLFLMTADHGASEVDPETTIYLNIHPHFAGFERFIRANRNGQLLVPAGSARDLFLYIKEGSLDEAQSFLAKRLEGQSRCRQNRVPDLRGIFRSRNIATFPGAGWESDCIAVPVRVRVVVREG